MIVVFVSNFYNHHQSDFSETLYRSDKIEFYFIETEKMEVERLNMGWHISKPIFVHYYYDNPDYYLSLILRADIVIFGYIDYSIVKKRISSNKITFIYNERLYKKKLPIKNFLGRIIKLNFRYNHKNVFLLCASAFTYSDFLKTGSFFNRAYKWGYFPPLKQYQIEDLLINKSSKITILWVGRFIDWKHPETMLKLADYIKKATISVKIIMVGNGVMFDSIRQQINANKLSDIITLTGAMEQENVRRIMETSNIFISTSDRNEGWGAVLNEAMNSGCAVIASSLVGSAPFLIKDGYNGFIYKDGSFESLTEKVLKLINDPSLIRQFGERAYYTICETWNGKNAAKRLLLTANALVEKDNIEFIEGPCSRAHFLKDNWYDEDI